MSISHGFVERLLLVLVIWAAVPRSVETSDGSVHECLRPCKNEPSSGKICRYEFFVSKLASGSSVCNGSKTDERVAGREGTLPAKSFLVVNGRSPGPSIQVCLGDTIEVLVHNRLGADELGFHWHGIRQNASAHMDGVPMVTQCPILPYGGFRYKIRPESAGTYFYHAHSVSQQADGVYGSLTVRGPRDEPTLERILLLSSRPPSPLTRHAHLCPPTPCEILVNGQASGTILRVEHGARYLLRLVNANAFNCPVMVSVAKHEFRALATDGNSVEARTGRRLILFPEGKIRENADKEFQLEVQKGVGEKGTVDEERAMKKNFEKRLGGG
ncbi:hypothetical protein KM043_015243 [Ampulex compressa]|nr:hypothetical protein KM043_015243 [Ampulex compressa]